MSGHSKWSTIKHKKGAADAKRGKLFSKLSRAIIVAAKEGGADPAANLALQNAIEKARAYSMPKDNIERAIARGSGADADAAAFETIVYEGYGPSGVAVLVEALTDNRNRTAAEVRHTFSKNDGNLGTSGAVAWLFERRGVVLVAADGVDEDELMLAAAEGGAEDVARDGSSFQVTSAPEDLGRRARRDRGGRLRGRVGRADDGPEDDGRGRGRGGREEDRPPDGRARGQRRRPGRLRELRHPRARAGGRRRLASGRGTGSGAPSARCYLMTMLPCSSGRARVAEPVQSDENTSVLPFQTVIPTRPCAVVGARQRRASGRSRRPRGPSSLLGEGRRRAERGAMQSCRVPPAIAGTPRASSVSLSSQ